jgi:hypothetical protein
VASWYEQSIPNIRHRQKKRRFKGFKEMSFLESLSQVQGEVTVLDILSGDPLLRDAARQAVLQWKYYPYYRRNGQACEVVTLARVRFILPKPMSTAAKQ